ncbi:LacI family DNA-binding transcriptional regulator [Anaeromicropila herbilytica]|uniref:LacI family transcriptional regulator n=1 Tax=Anaeromicropila herbilytica TaxID=2785025 RepID=A0A7R7EN69_9FIRM|nr:LacI family DNA-binding transcriptional regulator [Anaeromicropila herbilytica]BCN31946.1 LacI family transcriptional regulator [Anaeromicropila herbilytica]
MAKSITMKDIANELEVSTVTVSKALSDKEGVSEEVRERIKEKAKEMGYRFSTSSKSIKDGTHYNIGIIVAERFIKENGYYSNLYQLVVQRLTEIDYSGILEIISDDDESNGVLPRMIQNNKVDGLIILGQMSGKYIKLIEQSNTIFIFLDFHNEHSDTGVVIGDNVYGSYQVTNYLITMGHKEIGFIGDIYATSSIMDRYLGYYKSLLLNNIPQREEWIIKDRDTKGKICEFNLPDKMPTAFVCNCDEIAYILIQKLQKEGYRVPDDISVVGFDNYIYATLSSPKLTTYGVNLEDMAVEAVTSILYAIKHNRCNVGRKIISGNLYVRDSVKRMI